MKILMLCGNQPNHIALAHKVAARFTLAGLVIEEKREKKSGLLFFANKIIERIFFFKINSAWQRLMQNYRLSYKGYPHGEIMKTSNINSPNVEAFIDMIKPDLIMVSGTRIVKNKILNKKFSMGIINMHTGISPYVKGGPNCTNWCLANNEFHLIGNTVMWLDPGIDSGNIITTSSVDFTGDENLFNIHLKVMENAHQIYLNVVKQISDDVSKCPSVAQNSISQGNLYLSKMWTVQKKIALLRNISGDNWRNAIRSKEYTEKKKKLKLVKL